MAFKAIKSRKEKAPIIEKELKPKKLKPLFYDFLRFASRQASRRI